MTDEEMVVEDQLSNVSVQDVKEMFESIKLKDDNEIEKEEDVEEKPKKRKVVTEVIDKELSKEEVLSNKLYDEFSSFLEKKADITSDTGVKQLIPTGIRVVDAILGGGFAVGTLAVIVGQPGSGKTMLAGQAIGQGQKTYKGELIGAFLDSEEATTQQRLANLGVLYPKLKPYTDITVEKVFKFIEGLCLFKNEKKIINTPSIVVWDSIANTLSQKEREAEDINSVIGYKARMLSILIPKYVSKCAKNNICLLAINQLRDVIQMGPFSTPRDLKFMSGHKDMPGGNVLKFNAFHLVEMKVRGAIEYDKYGFDGILVTMKCVKNKIFQPNIEIEIVGSFLTGFSDFWTSYNFLVKTKRLVSGAWNYLVTLPNKKFRTKDAEELYKTDEEFKEKFDECIEEAINIDIIEKNSINIQE